MIKTQSQVQTLELNKTLVPHLGRTAKLMMIYMRQNFEKQNVDLTLKQWIVLKHLVEEDGREQKHLALITERDKTSLTRLISTLEKKGHVKRVVSDKDKRVNHLFITQSGRDAFESTLPLINKSIRKIQSGIDQEEIDRAIDTIKKVRNNIKHLSIQNSENK